MYSLDQHGQAVDSGPERGPVPLQGHRDRPDRDRGYGHPDYQAD